MNWLTNRLREVSTYAGGVLTAVGGVAAVETSVDPASAEFAGALAIVIAGIFAMLKKERGSK